MEYKNRRAVLGLVFIIIGALLLIDNLIFIPWDIRNYFFTWQMIFIAIGVLLLINGNKRGGFVMIGLGIFFWIPDYLYIDFDDYWPVILIIIGLGFFLKGRNHRNLIGKDTSVNYLDELIVFGGNKKSVESEAFEGGKITTIFGGTELDLTNCTLKNGKASLDIFTTFGGFNAKVPPDWKVVLDVTCIFGEFKNKHPEVHQGSDNELIIRGLVIFGGGDIK